MTTGRLEGWRIDPTYSIIWGYIYDDERKRFPDGALIHTSYIDNLRNSNLSKGDVVTTLNSTYLLGDPL